MAGTAERAPAGSGERPLSSLVANHERLTDQYVRSLGTVPLETDVVWERETDEASRGEVRRRTDAAAAMIRLQSNPRPWR